VKWSIAPLPIEISSLVTLVSCHVIITAILLSHLTLEVMGFSITDKARIQGIKLRCSSNMDNISSLLCGGLFGFEHENCSKWGN